MLLWLLVSLGLFFWTRWRILKKATVNIKVLGALLGIFLVLNISMFLFHKLYIVDSPNVIIILIDALRADRLSCYGNSRKTSPNIDEFAKDSALFTEAISQSTFTKTSIASLFTALYPHEHGVYEGNTKDSQGNITSDVFSEKETTLAEVLLQDEFITTAWVNNPHLRSYMGFAQGFVDYDEPARDIKRKFISWISGIEKRHKFFAYIHDLDLHDPYRPKPPYDTMYGVYSDVYSGVDFENWDNFREEVRQGKRRLGKKDVDQLLAYYDGQLTYVDSKIGLILDELKKRGLYDKTLIVLTGDHGDGFVEHGFISHSNIPYDELIRVPLIIKFPKSLHAGKVVNSQVRLIDVMPTIFDFLRIKVESKLSGFSLLNYLDENRNKKKKRFPKYAISEYYDISSIRTERYKYIDYPDKKDEIFDLIADPKEQNNIIEEMPDMAEEFHKMALGVANKRKKTDAGKAVLDKKTVEELKALGYIQ
jgi:arylsulfatase A-like enzyme